MAIEKGNYVKVEYTGKLDDGTVFDSSKDHGMTLDFEVGSGQLIKGFDDAVIGMEVGQEKTIKLTPDKAYGEPREELIKAFPKDQIPSDQEVKEGMMLMIGLPNGMQLPAKIVKVDDNEVTIDVNHPLAGKNLTFEIKVIEVLPEAPEGSSCCGGSCGDGCGSCECGDDCECEDESCEDCDDDSEEGCGCCCSDEDSEGEVEESEQEEEKKE